MKLSNEQKKLAKELTTLNKKFVINLVGEGMSQREAYLAAGGTAKNENTQDSAACTMLRDVRVKAFYDALMDSSANTAILTRQGALELLTKDAKELKDPKDRQAAIKQLSTMEGWNSAKKHEISGKDGAPIETATRIIYNPVGPDGK